MSRSILTVTASASTAALLAVLAAVPLAAGHGWVTQPPARNSMAGSKNGYCPHCGNGNGICGDGNQWPGGSDYLNYYQGPVKTWTAGTVVEVEVKVTAHHKGHYEFSICDQVISSATQNPQSCLDKWILERASPEEAGIMDCLPGDKRPGCQPIDARHPERFYLPPGGLSPDGSNTHSIFLKLPAALSCQSCTMQWRWWSANSCIPGSDYGCFANQLTANGYNPADWGVRGSCPGGGPDRRGCGEEFRNCVDITVLAGTGEPATTMMPTVTTTNSMSTTGVPTTMAVTSTAEAGAAFSCKVTTAGEHLGGSDAKCEAACRILALGSWPCGPDQLCECFGVESSTSTAARATSQPTTAAGAPSGNCVRNQDCAVNPWCQDAAYDSWCMWNADSCPLPQCVFA